MAITTLSTFIIVISFGSCLTQQPAYLQQYYAQVAQEAGLNAANAATPIFEQDNAANQQPQYIAQAQQIRVKDNVAEQVRVQQQQQSYVAPSVRQYLQQPQVQYVGQPSGQHGSPPPQPPQYRQPQPPKQTLAIQRQPVPSSDYHPQSNGGSHRPLKQEEEEEEYEQSNPSYQFGFDVKDDEFTNYQNRKEVRDGNTIKGSYSVVDSDGFIRTVTYTADPKEGFKAEVVREPTDIVVKIPTPAPQQQQQIAYKSQHKQVPQYQQNQFRPSQSLQHQHQHQHQHQQPQQQQQHQEYDY